MLIFCARVSPLSGKARSDNPRFAKFLPALEQKCPRRFRDVPVNWILEKGLLFTSHQDDETLSVGRV